MSIYLQKIKSFLNRHKRSHPLQEIIRRESANVRIVVGASGIFDPGWIPTDIDTLNMLSDSDWKKLFRQNQIAAILAEHVWEHLSLQDGMRAALNCYRYLRPGGYLRIAVPDGFHSDTDYIEYVKVGGSGCGADDHKVLYNYRSLKNELEEVGFKVRLLEYFDENGRFHYEEWSPADGMIYRSKRFDERNQNGQLKYTSLIADAVKPF